MPWNYLRSRFPDLPRGAYQAFVCDGGYVRKHYWTHAGWRWRTRTNRRGPESYGGTFELPNHPVVGVTWFEAVAFCSWLGE